MKVRRQSCRARKISVILADDHPVVRDGLAAIVNQQPDMQVVAEAGDGDEALDLYEQHKPDVMVLDLRMPKLDGAAVVQKVLEKYPKACLLIMTTYDGDEDIFRSLSQGAKGYLLKDAPRQEILSAIRAVADDRAVHLLGHRREGAAAHVEAEPDARASSTCCSSWPRAAATRTSRGASSITEGTAKTHVKAILGKLDAISRTEAVAVAHKRGLIHLS